MRRCIVTHKESSWDLYPARSVVNYQSDCFLDGCSAYLNSVLELEKVNPRGTQGSLVIINFCSFLRVLFVHTVGVSLFIKGVA